MGTSIRLFPDPPIETSWRGFYSNVRQPTAPASVKKVSLAVVSFAQRPRTLPSRVAPAMLRLMDNPEDTPSLPARYYRQKAAEARQAAEEATTRAIKERLHGSARDFDKLADAADRAGQIADPPLRVIPGRR
jgi:hypothetical protein